MELLVRICEGDPIFSHSDDYTPWALSRIVCKKVYNASWKAC